MKSTENHQTMRVWEQWRLGPFSQRGVRFGIFVGLLLLAFLSPLMDLLRLARKTELNSHILLIPFICGYLVWIRRREFPTEWTSGWRYCALALLAGAGSLGVAGWMTRQEGKLPDSDHLGMVMLGFYGLLVGGCFAFLGRGLTLALRFPLGMLLFMVPLPELVVHGSEIFLQHASADATHFLFWLTGTTVYREGMVFSLPGFLMEVAPECSGIRSSLILFITSLLAANLYLRSPWKQGLLILATLPIGILRNAIRIFTLSMLSIHVDPAVMKSSLHTEGGPLFFAGSLIPLFALLIFLRRSELRKKRSTSN